jgi:hypothetical protein
MLLCVGVVRCAGDQRVLRHSSVVIQRRGTALCLGRKANLQFARLRIPGNGRYGNHGFVFHALIRCRDTFFSYFVCETANIVPLDKISYTAVAMSSLVILTTGWAQDFADQDGDRLQGNITVPILAPRAARVLFPVALLLWAMTLITVWELGLHIAIPFIVFTAIVGGRFWFFRDTQEDEISFVIYNVSLSILPCLSAISTDAAVFVAMASDSASSSFHETNPF